MNDRCIACRGTGKVFVNHDFVDAECIKCEGTGKIMNTDDKMAILKQENPIHQLITTKPDTELAEELKAELMEVVKPYLDVATKALRLGFTVQMQMSPNAFKEVVVQQLNLMKMF